MEDLKRDIEGSGLQKKFIARKVGLTPQHLSMMINGKANMPDEIQKSIKKLIAKANSISA